MLSGASFWGARPVLSRLRTPVRALVFKEQPKSQSFPVSEDSYMPGLWASSYLLVPEAMQDTQAFSSG